MPMTLRPCGLLPPDKELVKITLRPRGLPPPDKELVKMTLRPRGLPPPDKELVKMTLRPRGLPPPDKALVKSWEREQASLRKQVVEEDTEEWQRCPVFSGLKRVGGVDLSYIKGDDVNACAQLVVLSYPDLKVLYEESRMVTLTAPYIAGFLAFREIRYFLEALRRLERSQPGLLPQVVFVDGNGLFHYREFGLACHLGVLSGLPCVGVAKNLLHVKGVARGTAHASQIAGLRGGGDSFPLTADSGKVLGKALRSSDRSTKPVYVSLGHKISLDTAVRLTHLCCRYRVPDPIRQADLRSRRYLRKHFPS